MANGAMVALPAQAALVDEPCGVLVADGLEASLAAITSPPATSDGTSVFGAVAAADL